jgi:SAM-dependent methyltransferase
LARSEPTEDDRYWGSRPIDLSGRDLPRIKAEFLVNAVPRAGRVLEIGCGGGRMLQTLAAHRPDLELHGVDIRPLRVPTTAFEFRLVDVADRELPFDADSFDAVLMFDFLEHLVDPAAHLADARRILRPEGRLVSFTPLEGNPWSSYRVYRRLLGDDLYVETKDHRQAFSEADLDVLLRPGFTVWERQYVYHALGQLMDATLFALLRIPAVRSRYSDENPYYQDDTGGAEGGGVLASLMRFANLLAYAESRALRRSRWGSAGILFWATPND